MCCFTQPVKKVADTAIFSRLIDADRQLLVYRMRYASSQALAMVLPIPVPVASDDDAVEFKDLSGYPEFFSDLLVGFQARSAFADDLGQSLSGSPSHLQVHDVGDYEASFVPQVSDFDRLDSRFRFPDSVWQQIPAYHDYGFAVFKLKQTVSPTSVHPMAFIFPTRLLNVLFFPTLHIHDGSVRARARFDHSLYCQASVDSDALHRNWQRSFDVAAEFIDIGLAEGLVDPDQFVWQLGLRGKLRNKDTVLSLEGNAL
jgi:hypothetical protein